ncbi:hypothetical protein BOTBODRAFT_413596 [Botryobasidium botryosum FD-172 SS1]|uniref:Xylanolytic transcriptional activator regulatory domain-containing protein n=1 Tax=Botryobasidium botryosum (strain FD-172 SS1) TaxID=930990 RepID=A0A067MD29_BOTB1|nr:hypothetical protein BOTBODRAFT_413596 [Botryobasidium botryosum FD-172 SS1]
MRCVFPEGEDVCVRCRNSNNRVECVVEARRPRQGPTKREQLIAQLRKKDKIIDVLLKRAYNPSVITPLTLSHSALLNNNNSNNNNGNGNGNADITGLSLPRLPDFSAAEGQTFDQDAILAWIEGSSSAASDTPDWAASAGAGAGMLGEGLGNGRMLSDDGLSEDEGASGPAETGTGNGNGNGNGAEGGGGDDSESGSRTSPIPPRPRSQQSQYTREPKLHSLPPVPTPIGLLAGLSLDASKTKSMRMLKERERRKSDRGKASDVGANDGSGGGGAAVNGNGNGNGNRSGNGNGKRASESWSADDEAVDIDMELDSADAAQEDDVGIANDKYFKPSAIVNPDLRSIIIERQVPPAILFSGLVTPAEVELLFNIFFEKLNPFVGVLDRAIHGPQQVLKRCPFLFTVVCAISSRYHTERPELYQLAMHFAKTSAATTLIDGWKSVEICQAYILLSTYPVPAKRWEEDRTWLYLGLAIRMATDLNLHLPSTTKPTSEAHEREILNRTRVWLICFNLDRSHATMFGRPNTIREDWIIRNSKDWYKRSKYNHPYDIHLCTYTQLLRIVARFLEIVYSDPHSPSGLNKTVDYAAVTKKFDEELLAFKEDAAARFAVESDPNDPGCVYRTELMPFLVNYSRLVMYSFGFQQAFDKGLARDDMFFVQCFHAASSVVRILIDKLAPHGHLRFSPDGNFIFASFACAFLVKLLRPQFGSTVDQTQRTRVVELVSRLVKVLGSEKTAIDEQHTPKLYARFLESILAKQGGEVIDADDSAAPPSSKTGSTPLKITLPSSREPPTASSSTDTDTTAHQAMRSPEIHIVPAPLETATQPIPTQNANGNGLSGLNAGHLNGSPDTRFLNADDALSSGSTIEAGGSDTATHYSADEEMMPIPAEARLASMRVLEEGSRWWDHGMMPGYDPDSPLQWGIWGAMEGPADFSNAMAAFAGVPDGQDVVMDINGNDDIFQNDFSAMSGNNFVPYRRS